MKSLSKTRPPSADENTRTLRRITALKDWQAPASAGPPHMKIAVLDTETTGLDPLYDEILELAVALIVIDKSGQIIDVEGMCTGRQQPSRPIEPHITAITGITEEMVAGKAMSPEKIADYLHRADACLAFHARFDRQHLEEFVPVISEMPWVCAMEDVPWQAIGYDGRSQGHLLMQSGMFNPVAHRAGDDVASLISLLAHQLADGRTVMSHALEHAQTPTWRFEATNLPYRFRKDVQRRGYAWADKHSLRHKLVRPADFETERTWYRDLIGEEPSIVLVDWSQRYRADWTWEPVKRKVEVASFRR